MKYNRLLIMTVLIIMLTTSIGLCAEQVDSELPITQQQSVLITEKAKVLRMIKDVTEAELNNPIPGETKQVVEVQITSGDYKGQVLELENYLSNHMYYDILVSEGDRITVAMEIYPDQNEYEVPITYISGFERDRYEFVILLLFMISLLVIGGLKGAKTIVSLSVTGIIILKYLIPSILAGQSPIFVSIIAAIIITTITLFIIAGVNKKSISAIIGTATGVVIAGVLAYIIGSLAKLTGLSSSEASMLMFIPQGISFDFRGLLFAGIIIGTLGAVMDIAMSISSSMYEIKEIEPTIRTKQLIKAGINIGRDVMGTMTNTLILAYTGTSLPLLLIFTAYDYPAVEILNLDLIATEIIRSLAGSIGIVLAIPFTAVSCGIIVDKVAYKEKQKLRKERHEKRRQEKAEEAKNTISESSEQTTKQTTEQKSENTKEPSSSSHKAVEHEGFHHKNDDELAKELDEIFNKDKK